MPRTGLADAVRRDPAVRDLVAREAERARHRAVQAADLPQTPPRARLADKATDALLDAAVGMFGLTLAEQLGRMSAPAEPGLLARYWAWNQRAFAWLADHVGQIAMGVWGASVAGLIIATLFVPDMGPFWPLVYASMTLVGLWIGHRNSARERRELEQITAAGLADALAAEFTWRDVAAEPFTAAGRCPNCEDLAVHWLAGPDRIPVYEADELPSDRVILWRECRRNGCGFVWAQLG